jgi:hypothetical protein
LKAKRDNESSSTSSSLSIKARKHLKNIAMDAYLLIILFVFLMIIKGEYHHLDLLIIFQRFSRYCCTQKVYVRKADKNSLVQANICNSDLKLLNGITAKFCNYSLWGVVFS